jgi:hypothetical protein
VQCIGMLEEYVAEVNRNVRVHSVLDSSKTSVCCAKRDCHLLILFPLQIIVYCNAQKIL